MQPPGMWAGWGVGGGSGRPRPLAQLPGLEALNLSPENEASQLPRLEPGAGNGAGPGHRPRWLEPGVQVALNLALWP